MSNAVASVAVSRRWLVVLVGVMFAVAGGVGLALYSPFRATDAAAEERTGQGKGDPPPSDRYPRAPELEGGVAWLNTGKPLTLRELRGKIVLLDFWTLCCINCIHIMPDLAKLEKKYANELVVIGVHSAKFENEKNSESIRKAILRYDLRHPVVNDAELAIWRRYEVQSWPTLILIDPEGHIVGRGSGEGLYDALDKGIAKLIEIHRAKKTLDEKPLRFDTAAFRDKVDSPLYFPGKVLADEKSRRLFIADSTNHRIVVTTLDGDTLAVAGTGVPGWKDGPFATAQFDDPQGMAVRGDTLYVADRKNHVIRELDLKTKMVKTIAGTGQQDRERDTGGPALKRGLNSPWDLLLEPNGDRLFIAMAGHHQIWVMNLKENTVEPFAGTGAERLRDGPHDIACFAQPSGLSTDGKNLFVADCEVSAVRKVPMDGKGRVTTLVGRDLFDFGDQDGPGRVSDPADLDMEAKLQHAIGVHFHDGKVYVADTYNSKIKVIDLKDGMVRTLIGPPKGEKNSPLNEPAGLSYAAGKLYIADTNAHRIQVFDLKTGTLSTLAIKGLQPVILKDDR